MSRTKRKYRKTLLWKIPTFYQFALDIIRKGAIRKGDAITVMSVHS